MRFSRRGLGRGKAEPAVAMRLRGGHTYAMDQLWYQTGVRGVASCALSIILLAGIHGCAKSPAASDGGVVDPLSGAVIISAGSPRPRMTSALGTSYWSWPPTWGSLLPTTAAPVLELAPFVLRIGGHNTDANTPDPFDTAHIDLAIP